MGQRQSRLERHIGWAYAQNVGGEATTMEAQLAALQKAVQSQVKPSNPAAGWTGKWKMDRRENWDAYLEFMGVPVEARGTATSTPDFHEYEVSEASFFMDHRIPAQNLHLRFTGFLDGEFSHCPYPRPTATNFDSETAAPEKSGLWKSEWIEYPKILETTIPDFGTTKHTFVLRRDLHKPDEIKYTTTMLHPETNEVACGPHYSYYARESTDGPMSYVEEMKTKTAEARSLEVRIAALDAVMALVSENLAAISAAQATDGLRPSDFTGASFMLKGAIEFYKASLPEWAKAQTVPEPFPAGPPGTWEVRPEAKGVGLIISPSNAPILLCLLPLLGMLSAGNLCVLKPADQTAACARLLARLVPKYFPTRDVVVVEGGRQCVEDLVASKFDHIVFTGGGSVGRAIAGLAAKHLTPISLELGGKNPCFIDNAPEEQLQTYVAEIVGTKDYFGGMFCQAMDYLLVHEAVFDRFMELLEESMKTRAPVLMTGCNVAALNRARRLTAGVEHLCRPPLLLTEDSVNVTAVVEPPLDSAVMQEEVFCPLLPVYKVSGVTDAATFVRRLPKPLVAYCYSPSEETWGTFAANTSSGNLGINAGPQRMQSNFNIGFGGVGESGYGFSIWGKAAFDDYSHRKPVFKCGTFSGSIWGAGGKGKGKGGK